MRHLVALSVLLAPAAALAGSSGTADVACGSSSTYWSAPNGAVVFNRGAGPLREVITSVGESRTHSMISNASVKYVTHANARTPGRPGWPTYCDLPLEPSELEKGKWGASQVNQGAIYTYLYANGTQEYVRYQNGNGDGTNKGGRIADYFWNTMPYAGVYSEQDGGHVLYRLKNSAGNSMPYVLYQFRNQQNANSGGSNWADGIMCSTLIALGQRNTLGSSYQISSYTYSNSRVNTALNALYSGVYNQCDAGFGFWSGVGSTFTCLDLDLCDDAGDEVANCMTGSCYTSDSDVWRGVIGSGATANTISPDRVGGWSGHPYSGSGVSVWAYDNNHDVTWASSGNTYGCWF